MNIEMHLILVKNEDKTEQIDSYKINNGIWKIKYHNTNKEYPYKKEDVRFLSEPKSIDPKINIVYANDQPISGINKILDFGSHIRIIFNSGFKKIYKSSEIAIEKTSLSNAREGNTFEYLKTLANAVSIKLDGDVSFLRKQYNNLTQISPRSVLSAYLGKKNLITHTKQQQIIFPFGFNASQKAATEKTMTSQLSMIEGPPGTGKTQTILNIIANAVINNKTVAIVSNNNSATENVMEKLRKYGIDFIAAYLGNKDNQKKFFSEQNRTYPNMSDWVMEEEEIQSIKTYLHEEQLKLNDVLESQNRRAILKRNYLRFKPSIVTLKITILNQVIRSLI
ncbi:AAA domain-containing protein [Ornithinibacillus caprae]|uniref:AAA domain-containing protein n=1 Tax=Ornithinibacillus caprae TaxID=2678566 RepID=UPI0018C47E68|nr:AAA domain-containing protein [Ornithinibacillus caprae]